MADTAGGLGMARFGTIALLVAGLMLLASPASADHEDPDGDGNFCVDSSTAHPGDPLINDTDTTGYCIASSGAGGGPESAGGGTAGAGGVAAVPTRIDAGAGGAAMGGNFSSLGVVLTGATSAAAAVVARRRRRG